MITTRIEDSIAWLQINRPKQKNALSIELLEQILETLTSFEDNSEVKVIVIEGKDNFSAGGDLSDMLVDSNERALELATKIQNIYLNISKIPKPIIAYTKGVVLGGGLELALVCDFIIAHSNSIFSMPEASFGIVPGGGATQRLKAIIGKQNASYLFFTGQELSAQRMLEMGLVQKICDKHQDAKSIALSVAKMNTRALKELKILLQKDKDFEAESKSFANLLQTEGQEAIQSFLKRKS